MAQVGTKREPRLPMGPPVDKIDKIDDDMILDPEIETKLEESKDKDKDKDKDKFDEIKIAKIPLPPSKRIPDTDTKLFYDWMTILKPEHWVQLTWYMYRNWPRLNKPDDDVKYIDCGNYAITEQWILENHGSGDYMFICNEAGKPKNAKTICTAYVKNLVHPEYPPKVKMNELDVHFPSNKNYVDRMVAEGKLTVDLKPMNSSQQQNGGLSDQIILKLLDKVDKQQITRMDDPKDSAIKAAFEIIGQGNKAATQMMLDQMKQDDPDKLVKLVQTIMGMVPKPPEHNGSETTTFMKMLVESQNKNAELMAKKDDTIMAMMMKMMESKTTPSDDGSFDKTIDRFMKFMELTGMEGLGGGGKKSTLEVALQYGSPILERALGIVQNLMALKAQGAPKIDPITGKEVLSNQAASPLPISIASSPIQSTEQPTNKQTGKSDVREAMVNNSAEQEDMIKQGLRQIGPKIIEALNRRTSGDTFAESIDNFLGPMVYNQLASLGESKMIEILQTDVALWNQLKLVEPQLKIFIKEFIDYGKPDSNDDDDKIIDADDIIEDAIKPIPGTSEEKAKVKS